MLTPSPRELYVERLVSQSRNGVWTIKLDGAAVPAGGSMTLMVGGTYDITLEGATATQGYNQLESFINFPNTIFQVLAVSTAYTADTSNFVTSPNDRLYADACGWENHPASPNYRSCVGVGGVGSDGKAGGGVITTYTVRILSGGGTTQTLTSLVYDFSGSSYHYNADYSFSTRFAQIVNPAPPTFAKAFAPSTVLAGGTSMLSLSIGNANPAALTNVSFTDVLPAAPAQLLIAAAPAATLSGCGAATLTAAPGTATIALANATVAANGTCTINVPVVVPAAPLTGNYINTTGPLSVNGTATAITASATLNVVNTPPATGVCGITMAQWSFGTIATPTLAPSVIGVNVGAATIAGGNGLTVNNDASTGSPAAPSARMFGWQDAGPINTGTSDYAEFTIDTDSYSNVAMSFNGNRSNPGPTTIEIWYSVNGGTTWTRKATFAVTDNSWLLYGPYTFTAGETNPTGNTLFRIYGYGAKNQNQGADLLLDNLTFTGCGVAQPPTLTKAFAPNPITVGGTSTLTFTLTNPNTAPLTGARFLDTLPAGMTVASPLTATNTCGASWAPVAGATSLAFGQTTGGTIPASGSCTATVNVTASSVGAKLNISDFIYATESGANTTASGAAVATLTVNAVVLPAAVGKAFSPPNIAAGQTSILTATIVNPNATQALTGVQLVDVYPAGLTSANPLVPAVSNGCGGTLVATAGGNGFSLTGVTLAAGADCIVRIPVTSATAGAAINTTAPVQSIEGGPGNTASATLSVVAAAPVIQLSKKVRIAPAGPWLDSVVTSPGTQLDYQFVVENLGNVPFSSFAVADPLLAGTLADPAGCAWQTVNVPTTLPGLPVASAALDPTASCVRGPVVATAGQTQNTATATGVYNAANFTDSDQATYLGAVPGLSLTKQIGLSASGPWLPSLTVAAGTNVFYRFTIVNSGNTTFTGVSIADPSPAIDESQCTYVDPLPPGGISVCTLGPVVAGGAAGSTTTNTATASGADGGGTVTTPPSSASYTIPTINADVSLVKTLVTAGPFTIGQSISYTLQVGNAGPSTATSVQVTDTPTNLTITSVSGGGCTALPCTIPSLASGASVTINVTATIIAAGAFDNSATALATETDPNLANNTDNTGNGGMAGAVADLAITKTNGAASVVPGATTTYLVVVTNLGPSPAGGASVVDTFPAAITAATWTAVGANGATCPASGVGSINATVDLPVSGSCTFTVVATISAGATGTLVNTATVSPPAGVTDPVLANNSATDSDPIVPAVVVADLSVTKTDGVTTVVAGTTTTYTIAVANAGPDAAPNATLTDTLPAQATFNSLTAPAGWSCVTPAVGATGTITCSNPSFASGGSATFTLSVTVAPATPSGTTLTNTAIVASGASDPTPGNNTATDVDTVTASADLAVVKSNGVNGVTSGTPTTYTVTVTNSGPSTVTGAILTDPAVAGLSKTAVACAAPPGTCVSAPTAGQLEAGFALPTLASGATYRITVTANVTAASGSVSNTATVTLPAGVTDPTPGNNSSTDTDPVTPATVNADLAVTKTDGTATVVAGGTTTYTIVITNAGPDAAPNATLTDTLPAQATFNSLAVPAGWSCTTPAVGATGTVSCSIASLPNGASATFTLAVTVAAATPAGTSLSNTAVTASGASDPTPANNTATDVDTVTASADLAVVKSNGATGVASGTPTTYTVTVTNNGPSTVTGATLADPAVAGLTKTAVACATPPGACASAPSVAQLESGFVLPMLANGTTYSIAVTANVTATSGNVSNTATVAPPAGVTDPTPGNNSSTDTDPVTPASTVADLTIVKTNNVTQLVPGGAAIYTLVVTNLGPAEVSGATVTDLAPPGLTFGAWTCSVTNPGAGGSVTTACVTGAGVGNVVATVDMKVGAVLTFTVPATVSATATGTIVNSASVAAPPGITDPVNNNNAATETDPVVGSGPTEVPTLSEWALVLLSLMLAMLGLRARRARA